MCMCMLLILYTLATKKHIGTYLIVENDVRHLSFKSKRNMKFKAYARTFSLLVNDMTELRCFANSVE